MNLNQLLLEPIVTERSLDQGKLNRFTFRVDRRSTKHQIREAVERQFGVHVVKVWTLSNKGTQKRTGKRRLPKLSPTVKKAIVAIKSGESIAVFDTKG
jgi:large subunit ribosomal protein L23